MGRVLTPIVVALSFVPFGFEVAGSGGWWVYASDRATYVLAILAVVGALLTERREYGIVRGARIAVAAVAVVFMVVAVARFYGTAIDPAYPWATEAQVLALAAVAFGLTLTRTRNLVAIVGLVVAIAATVACALYAITQKATYAAEMWWWIVIAAAFLAAAAASALEREDAAASNAPGTA